MKGLQPRGGGSTIRMVKNLRTIVWGQTYLWYNGRIETVFFTEIENMDTNDVNGGPGQESGELSSSGSSGRGRQNVWKVVTFAVVAALAGTLAAHSLLTPASCGGCGGGGGWMKTGAACPEQVAIKTAAYTGAKPCCPGAEASFASVDCPLAKQGGEACPNKPGAPKHPCGPAAGASVSSTDCPLVKQAASCPNSPGAKAAGCCPGGRHRWGQK